MFSIEDLAAFIKYLGAFVLGCLFDFYLHEFFLSHWARIMRKVKRAFGQHRESDRGTVLLGNRDTYTTIIGGEGVLEYAPHRIICRKNEEPLDIPDLLKERVKEIQEEEEAKKASGKRYQWNGDMIHIERFNDTRIPNVEEGTLELSVRVGEYYHWLASVADLYRDFPTNGFSSPLRRELIGKFSDWRSDTPPNTLNGLPVNLHIITDDNKFVFAERAEGVGMASGETVAAINENIHPDADYRAWEKRFNFETLIQRALVQEAGWNDSEHSGKTDDFKATVRILLFTVEITCASYGLLGYVHLPISFNELLTQFETRCRDRWEIKKFVPVDCTIDEVCTFIHQKKLYNPVGLGAVYTLVHCNSQWRNPLKRIRATFEKLQATTTGHPPLVR